MKIPTIPLSIQKALTCALLFCTLIATSVNTLAQNKPEQGLLTTQEDGKTTYYLAPGDYHLTGFGNSFDMLFSKPFTAGDFWNKSKRELSLPYGISIRNCVFHPFSSAEIVSPNSFVMAILHLPAMDIASSKFLTPLSFMDVDFTGGAKFDANATSYWGGHLDMQYNESQNIHFYKFKGMVSLADNTFTGNSDTISTSNSSIVLSIKNTRLAKGTLRLMDNESTILLYYQSPNPNIPTSFTFQDDTLKDLLVRYPDSHHSISFANTRLITKRFSLEPDSAATIQSLSFNNCHFEMPITFNDYRLDTIKIARCKKIATSVAIEHTDSKNPLYLDLTDTDPTNIDFAFTDNYKLVFDPIIPENSREKVYQSLLDKFKKEGQTVSYKNVDILYQKFTFEQYGSLGKAWSYIDYQWWDYSYKKWKIIMWTAIFVMLFFLVNLLRAPQLFLFYPIFSNTTEHPEKSIHFRANKVVLTFVLTLYIFFGLKVDFDKLRSKQTGMMVYFFMQYFVGLICLFFLFNAILKL